MKKIRGIQRQKTDWRTWRLSLAFNLLILGVMLMLFCPKYESKADVVMQNLLYGTISGLQTTDLVFSNVILGKILGVFTALFPNGAWYTFLQIFFILAALTGIGYVILSRLPGTAGKVLLLFILCFLGYESYVTIGYLRTACLLTVSGSLLYTAALREGKERLCAENVFAFILFLVGSLYSFWVFCLVFAVGMILPAARTVISKSWKRLLRLAIDAAVIVLVCTALWGVDCLSYRGAGSEYALEYRNDFEMIFFKDSKRVNYRFDEVSGVETSGQGWAVSQGVFLNGTEEALTAVRDIARQTKVFTTDTVNDYFKSIPISLFSIDSFYLWLGLSVVFLAFSKERLKVWLPSFLIVLVGAFIIYFTNALNSGTAYFILFAVASMVILDDVRELRMMEWRSAAAFASVLFILLYTQFSGSLLTTVRKDKLAACFDPVRADREYLIDLDRICRDHSAFERYRSDLVKENIIVVNGFYSTMTAYDTPSFETHLGEEISWLANPAGFPLTDLVDFSTDEDLSGLSITEEPSVPVTTEDPSDLPTAADPDDPSENADPKQ